MSPMPSGRAILDSERLLQEAGLSLDMSYADLGSGMLGHFVLPASQIVGPNGTVYAVDILKTALQSVESRAQLKALTNVQSVWGDLEHPNGIHLPANALDLVSFVNMAHLLQTSVVPLQHAKRLLHAGGHVLVIDWNPQAGSLLVSQEHRVSSEDIKQRFLAQGFSLTKQFIAGPQHWGLLFERP